MTPSGNERIIQGITKTQPNTTEEPNERGSYPTITNQTQRRRARQSTDKRSQGTNRPDIAHLRFGI